jgi:Fe/S biogenesis protein NfuA
MMITLTEGAKSQITAALEKQGSEKQALRIEARTNSTAEFVYAMKLVGTDNKTPEDTVLTDAGFEIFLDPDSASNLKGATIDFEEGILRSGFKFDNPNKPEVPELGEGPRGDLSGDTADQVERLINSEINPAVGAHGGRVSFLGVRDNKVFLRFGGGCHGCGMVDVTLKQGIEKRIKELIPEIVEVVDVTDHHSGENPFYK